MMLDTTITPFIFLFGATILMAIKTAIRALLTNQLEEEFSKGKIRYYLFRKLETLFPQIRPYKSYPLKEFLNLTAIILFIAYGASGALFFNPIYIGVFLVFSFIFDTFARNAAIATLKLFSFIGSIYLITLFPITYPLIWLEKKLSPKPSQKNKLSPSEQLKKRLSELLQEAEIQNLLDPMEQKLVSSIAQFGDLVAREIMIPRPDMLCLPEKTSIYESLHMFIKEGYSRIPLYGESIDDITTVLLYKDVMEFCVNALEKSSLDIIKTTPASSLANEILYSPENKKIRDLFQEMRTKKIHAAIVVNEYGGTEGLITIEDILEELVGGEIQDEHDEGEEILYKETLDKSWIVDATMSIIDVEKELGTRLPHGPEYETIAGFISLQAGCIPKPGTIIHGEHFHIEVLKSDERQILEVKITPEKRETLDL